MWIPDLLFHSLKAENRHKSAPRLISSGALVYTKVYQYFVSKHKDWQICLAWNSLPVWMALIQGSINGFQTMYPLWKSGLNVEGIWQKIPHKVQLLQKVPNADFMLADYSHIDLLSFKYLKLKPKLWACHITQKFFHNSCQGIGFYTLLLFTSMPLPNCTPELLSLSQAMVSLVQALCSLIAKTPSLIY